MDNSVGNIECRITLEFPMFFIVADSRSVRLLPSPHQGFCHCHNFGDQKSQHPSMGSVVLQHYHQRGPPTILLCSSSECCWCRCWGLYPDYYWNSHTGKNNFNRKFFWCIKEKFSLLMRPGQDKNLKVIKLCCYNNYLICLVWLWNSIKHFLRMINDEIEA